MIFRGNVNILTLYEARFSTEHESIASRPTGTVTFTTGPTNRGISVKILKKKIQNSRGKNVFSGTIAYTRKWILITIINRYAP